MKLFNYIDFPIVSTSVNYSNLPAMTNIEDILKEFKEQVDYINITSPDSIGSASTIIDFTDDNIKLIREGEVPFNKIEKDFNEFRNNHK
jgi:tRNA A37 threonylcarbamoyladenosine synthetase subunit TsaC/SUA5/YrdC